MIYRWIHTVWRAFTWLATLLFSILLVASLLLFGLFQLPQSKQWLAGEVERQLTTQFQGTFRIERISGIPPFHLTLHDIRVTLPESEVPVLASESARLALRPWNLIRQRVTFQQIHLEAPEMHLRMMEDHGLNLSHAFSNRQPVQPADSIDRPLIQTTWEWIAPRITMESGSIHTMVPDDATAAHPLRWLPATGLEASFYLEITDEQRFLEIDHLRALFADERLGPIQLRGQIFSDSQFMELNGFELSSRDSRIRWSLDASPVDLAKDEWQSQLREAVWRIRIDEATMPGERLQRLWNRWPITESMVEFSLQGEGTADQFYVDRITSNVGKSSLIAGAVLEFPLDSTSRWEASIRNLLLSSEEADQLGHIQTPVGEMDPSALSGTRVTGQLSGTRQTLSLDLETETLDGRLTLDGQLGFGDSPTYGLSLQADSLQYAPLFPDQIRQGELNGALSLQGEGYPDRVGHGELTLDLQQSQWNQIPIEVASTEIQWENGKWTYQSLLRTDRSSSQIQGELARIGDHWASRMEGTTTGLDLTRWVVLPIAPVTHLDMEFDTSLEWREWTDLSGRIGLHVRSATVNGERLNRHQFFADLDPVTDGQDRQLRLTSSLLDAELTGTIEPDNLLQSARYWDAYLQERVHEEIRMTEAADQPSIAPPDPVRLELRMDIKDLNPLQAYFPNFPAIQTRGRISLSLESSPDRMLLTGSASDTELQYRDLRLTRPDLSLTASFQHDTPLREYAAVDLRILAEDSHWGDRRLGRHFSNLSVRNDTVMVHQTQMDGEFLHGWDMTLLATLSEGSIDAELRQLYMNLESVEWIHDGVARLRYDDRHVLDVQGFALESNEQRIAMDGRYSNYQEDEVRYEVENLDLSLLSDALDERVRFSGRLNGEFVTSMLTRDARLGGAFTIRDGHLMNRPVGLVTIESNYHPAGEHFDTRIEVRTDPEEHAAYLESNNGIGNHLLLDGNVSLPSLSNPGEEFFYFDADLREIDTWIASVIVPKIIEESEGRTSGWGFVSGSLENINFRGQFDIDQVLVTPTFINTRYRTNGRLVFDRHEGLRFDRLDLLDSRGGTGRLSGTVDLDNFSRTNIMDLTLDLDNLVFMNNPYNPEVPFYATTRGTGQARITGTNFNPFLRTSEPIIISSGSRISLPLLEETELQRNHNFIQFVEEFDLSSQASLADAPATPVREESETLTFAERFTLDLQFVARDPVTFQLVFDPVTNEVLNAQGTGQVRLSLEDQTLNVFGRMNIVGGDYQFVAGDIISRRFQLQEGGSILWEGDPTDARLNVEAIYRSRPDLTSLLTTATSNQLQGARRVPVDLVLTIGGTLSELENDFYFQTPSNIEGTLDPTLLTQMSALNRNEEEKVIQATSLLLSGNFIPLASSSSEGGTGTALRESLSSGTVVNPLITGQVINPLLSDQINSLLRSDMAVDIDFNLTPYNQVDLGVALRLYDDRLIFRRDGQITGPYSDIGDLGATWVINNTFALTAFHRQDPSMAGTGAADTRQVQEMNGVGVEARVQYNTWQELGRRIRSTWNRLWGREEENNENPSTDTDESRVSSDARLQDMSRDLHPRVQSGWNE